MPVKFVGVLLTILLNTGTELGKIAWLSRRLTTSSLSKRVLKKISCCGIRVIC